MEGKEAQNVLVTRRDSTAPNNLKTSVMQIYSRKEEEKNTLKQIQYKRGTNFIINQSQRVSNNVREDNFESDREGHKLLEIDSKQSCLS